MSHKLKYLPRVRVIWWGPAPTPEILSAFGTRNLMLEVLPDELELPGDLSTVSAVVLCDSKERPRFSANLEKTTVQHLDHGIRLVGIAADGDFARFQTAAQTWSARLGRGGAETPILLIANQGAHDVVHQIANHAPTAGANTGLRIHGCTRPEDETLLKRAFCDCSEIQLQRLSGGRSADAYWVHATLLQSATGTRPQPFFVKIGPRRMIETELRHYDDRVTGFVPFLNRPNLAEGRCLLGGKRGILVGTFVDRSEKFVDVAKRGDASALLNSLFDEALRGWRQQSYDSPAHAQYALSNVGPVMTAIDTAYSGGAVDLSRIRSGRVSLAMSLGLKREPAAILCSLRSRTAAPFRQGPIHGDLHVDNICSFRGSAILIDFYSARTGPLVCDPAALEVSVLMHECAWTGALLDGKPKFAQLRSDWSEIATRLAGSEYLNAPPPPASVFAPREWVWNCIRHIRMHALSAACGPDEYRTGLVTFLLRAAGYSPDAKPAEAHRRAMALVLADSVEAQIGAP